jgi:hypothetical protein
MADKRFIIDNLAFRLFSYYPNSSINLGRGNPNARLVVINADHETPERDGMSGALNRFGLLEHSYRLPWNIVNDASDRENISIAKELIEIIRPLVVVTSGEFVTQPYQSDDDLEVRFGKKFLVKDLKNIVFYAITNPEQYSFARASVKLKKRGKEEWDGLYDLFNKINKQHEEERWKV